MPKNQSATIITITFNDLVNLKMTVESVLSYKDKLNIEYIVVDGGSTDGTLEYLNSLGDKISKFISEKDYGIGDAWNKGIKLASTDIVNLLNAGDRHLPELVLNSINALTEKEGITFANTLREIEGEISSYKNGDEMSQSIYQGVGFYFPTCFVSRSVYEKVGLYNTNISIAVDTDWLIRAKLLGFKFEKVAGITIMDANGVSSVNRKEAHWQYMDVLQRNGYSKLKINYSKFKFLYYQTRARIMTSIRNQAK